MIKISPDNISEVFDEHSNAVFRVALSVVRNREEAQDIVMDTFMELIKQPRIFEDSGHLRAWLIRTGGNKSINVVKSARMRRNVPLDEILEGSLTAPVTESERDMLDMVMRLPDKLKSTVYMFYYEDMPAAEIAQALGISENTVYKRLERGRKLLKINLEEEAI